MEMTFRARLRRGLGGQAFSQVVTVAVQIGGVPLFLHFWGASLYGEWLMLVALSAWFVLTSLGFTTAGTHEVTMRVARRDFDGALAVFRTAWTFVTALSLAVAAALATGAAVSPVASWFGFSELGDAGAAAVIVLLLGQVFVHMQTELLGMGLIAAGRYGLYAFLVAATRLAAFLLVALALVLGGGPTSAAAAMAGVECAGFLVVAGFARRHGPWLRYGLSGDSAATLRRLAVPSIGFAGLTAGNALGIQGPILVIGAALEPTAVAVFSTLRLLARAPVMFANVVFATLRPEAAIAHGRGDGARVRRLNTGAVQFALWLAAAAFVAAMLLGPWIVDLWTGGRIAVRQPLFVLLLVAGAGTLLWTGAATALHATNNNREIAAVSVLATGAGLLAALAAVSHAGSSGVAAAMAGAELVVFVLILRRALAFLGQRPGELLRAVLRPPAEVLGWFLPGRLRIGP